jgi:hypothetical protein
VQLLDLQYFYGGQGGHSTALQAIVFTADTRRNSVVTPILVPTNNWLLVDIDH